MVQRWSSGVNLIRPLFTYLREVRLLPCSYATRTTTSTCSSPDKERRVTHRLGRDGREHARDAATSPQRSVSGTAVASIATVAEKVSSKFFRPRSPRLLLTDCGQKN